MARLRFPGRPGLRFDRLGIRYGAEEANKRLDASTQLIANIHRGLRCFREYFGDSDEDEFEGFSANEVAQTASRLNKLEKDIQDLEKTLSRKKKNVTVVPPPVFSQINKNTASPPIVPTVPKDSATKLTASQKSSVKQTVKKLVEEGIAKPASKKPLASLFRLKGKQEQQVQVDQQKTVEPPAKKKEKISLERKEGKVQRAPKLKAIKIRLGTGGKDAEIVSDSGKSKENAREERSKRKEKKKKKTEEKEKALASSGSSDDDNVLYSLAATDDVAEGDVSDDEVSDDEVSDDNVLYSLAPEPESPVSKKGKSKKVVVKPQTKKVVKAQQILAQAKKKKKRKEEHKKVKQKNEEDNTAETDAKKKPISYTKSAVVEKSASLVEPKVQKDSTPSKPKPVPRQFVLPTVSSRSSRKITPVRFFDDEQFPSGGSNSAKFKVSSSPIPMQPIEKTPIQVAASQAAVPVTTLSTTTAATTPIATTTMATATIASSIAAKIKPSSLSATPVASGAVQVLDDVTRQPKLFEAPLVVQGKRVRKPSHKLIEKLVDEDVKKKPFPKGKAETKNVVAEKESEQIESYGNLPLGGPAALAGLIDKKEKHKVPKQRAESQSSDRQTGAVKRSGQNIVKKAKLQLNKAKLSRVSRAVAISLKIKMKREERVNRERQRKLTLKQQKLQQQQTLAQGKKPAYQFQPLDSTPPQLAVGGKITPQFGCAPALAAPLSPMKFETGTVFNLGPASSSTLVESSPKRKEGASKIKLQLADILEMKGLQRIDTKKLIVSTKDTQERKKYRAQFKKDHCYFCKQVWTMSQKRRNRFYFDVPTCEACKVWYKRRCMDELTGTVLKCRATGSCDPSRKKCSACRYKLLRSMLPPPNSFYTKIAQKDKQSSVSAASEEPESSDKNVAQSVTEETPNQSTEALEEKTKEKERETESRSFALQEITTSVGGTRITSTTQSALTRQIAPQYSTVQMGQKVHQPTTTYWGLKTSPTTGSDSIFKTPISPKMVKEAALQMHTAPQIQAVPQVSAAGDTRVTSGVMIKITNSEGQEAPVDVEHIGAQPLTPRPLTPMSSPITTPVSSPLKSPFGSPTKPEDGLDLPSGFFPGSPESISSVPESPVSVHRGPRIKHVCRKAAVALGQPLATFCNEPEFRLSALPSTEKERLLEDRSESEDSDDMSMDEIIRQARSDPNDPTISPQKPETSPGSGRLYTPGPKAAKAVLVPVKGPTKNAVMYKRKMRCKKCKNCLVPDCRKCAACKNMPKYGGSGTMKQSCSERPDCEHQILPGLYIKKEVEGKTQLIKKRSLTKQKNSDDESSDSDFDVKTPRKQQQPPEMSPVATSSAPIQDASSAGDVSAALTEKTTNIQKPESSSAAPPAIPTSREGMRSSTRNRVTVANTSYRTETSISSKQHDDPPEARHQLSRIPTKLPQSMEGGTKRKGKKEIKVNRGAASSTLQTRRYKWPSEPQHSVQFVKADYLEDFDIDEAWRRGVAIVSSTPTCLRTICFLCASHGGHDMVYCSVCCEPFHKFCLEDTERPLKDDKENWCCPRCHFCHVCGKQNNLLQCDKCHDTYHPGCLGPYYPTKPSKGRGIWICTKCVKCKSCGATTPGLAYNATWTHDFSLCYDCGMQMDKGNYCPICHSTYADDDWDCKMIQCSTCTSWVHAKCEGMTDDMYQIFSYLPEDIAYHCRQCYPMRPAPWETIIKDEMQGAFITVIGNMLATKLASNLGRIEDEDPRRKTREQVKAALFTDSRPQDSVSLTADPQGQGHSSQNNQSGNSLQVSGSETTQSDQQIENKDTLETYLTDQSTSSSTPVPIGQQIVSRSANVTPTNQSQESLNGPMDVDAVDQSARVSPDADGSARSSDATDTASELGTEPSTSGTSSMLVSPTTEPTSMDFGQPGTGSTEPGGPSIAEELLRAIMENPQSTPDKEAQRAMEGLFQGLKPPEPKVTFSNPGSQVKDSLKIKIKTFPRDLKEIRKRVQEHRYRDIRKFTDDIARVLQFNREDTQPYARKKACTNIQLIFLKEMQKYFPWVNVKTSIYWSNVKLPDGMLPGAVVPPSEDHSYAQYRYRDEEPKTSDQPSPFKRLCASPRKPSESSYTAVSASAQEAEELSIEALGGATGEDLRKCLFCQNQGDDDPDDCGRLLYAGQDDWVHVNCALWSAEVYEEVDGTLQNVHAAIVRGKQLRCNFCERSGATVGCCALQCHANFHFMCAREDGSVFQEDKKVYCKLHTSCARQPLMEENFAVERRACIDQSNNKWIKSKWSKGLNAETVNVIAGSMTVERLGRLTPLSDRKGVLIPVGYTCTRVYWSTNDARRRTVYTCRVIEVHPSEHNETALTMKNVTIIHDKSHPDYSAEAEIRLRQLTVSISSAGHLHDRDSALFSPMSDTSYAPVFSEDESCFLSPKRKSNDRAYYNRYPAKKMKIASESEITKPKNMAKVDIDSIIRQRSKSVEPQSKTAAAATSVYDRLDLQVSRIQSRPSSTTSSQMSMSASWPGASPTSVLSKPPQAEQKKVNLSCLSANTLKLLKNADLSKYTCSSDRQAASVKVPSGDDLMLTQIANRLNDAAARNKPERSSSSTSLGEAASHNTSQDNIIVPPVVGPNAVKPSIRVITLPVKTTDGGSITAAPISSQAIPGSARIVTVTKAKNQVVVTTASGTAPISSVTPVMPVATDATLVGPVYKPVATDPLLVPVTTDAPLVPVVMDATLVGPNAVPVVQSTPSKNRELVEAEIIDENTGTKMTMMVSPGQVAQLRAGTMEVVSPQRKVHEIHNESSNSTTCASTESQQMPKTSSPKQMPISGQEKVTQQIRDKHGNVIGVQVMPRAVAKPNTTRRQLVQPSPPRKPLLGPLTNDTATTSKVTESRTVNTSKSITETISDNTKQSSVVQKSQIEPSPGGATEESESDREQPMYVDGANDERPKKKSKLAGPKSAQFRRVTRSVATESESEAETEVLYVDGTDDERKGKEETKSYGLRNTAFRAASQAERRHSMPEVSVSLKMLTPESVRRISKEIKEGSSSDVSTEGDVPLHSKIAARIKAESLARSAASGTGPMKCPKCKRLYRTKESCDKHVATCTFELSDSDEEDDPSGEETSPRALRRSRTRGSPSAEAESDRTTEPEPTRATTRASSADSVSKSPPPGRRVTRTSAASTTKPPEPETQPSNTVESDAAPRHPRRKSAILCGRMTKDYAEEFGPDDPGEDVGGEESISSMEMEEVEPPQAQKDAEPKVEIVVPQTKEKTPAAVDQDEPRAKKPKKDESDDDCMVVHVEPPDDPSPPRPKQKRVKIVSVGTDGQCHELAKAHIPPGKIADVMKALKSAHMSKVDSCDKLQELAENILKKTKDGQVNANTGELDSAEIIKQAGISISVVTKQPSPTTATVAPVQGELSAAPVIKSQESQPLIVTRISSIPSSTQSISTKQPLLSPLETKTYPRILKSPNIVLNKVPISSVPSKTVDMPLKAQVVHKNIPVQKVSPRVVTVSPQQKPIQGGAPQVQPHIQSIPQPPAVQAIQPNMTQQGIAQTNIAQLAPNVQQMSSAGFQMVPGVGMVVSSGMGFPGGATVVYSGGQIVSQQPQVVVQQILQGPVVQHQHILMPNMQSIQPQIQNLQPGSLQLNQINQSPVVLQGTGGSVNVIGQTASGQMILQDTSATNQPILPATAHSAQPVLTIDPTTQQIVQTRVQPNAQVMQAQPQQLMTLDQAGNLVAIPPSNLGMMASNAGVQGIAGLLPGVQMLSRSGQVIQQVANLQPQPPAPSPVVQQGTVVAPIQPHPPQAITPVLQPQQQQQQQKPKQLQHQGHIVPQQNVVNQVNSENVFENLSASELIKSMAQSRNTTCTVTTSSNVIAASSAQFQFGQSQAHQNVFENTEQFGQQQQEPKSPSAQFSTIDASVLKLTPQSPLIKAALQSTPVVSLQRLKPKAAANPLKLDDIGSTNMGTITIQKVTQSTTVQLQSSVTSSPQFSQAASIVRTAQADHHKKLSTEQDLKDQLLSTSPKKGQILGPVVKKLTHAEMMQLLTSKTDSSQTNTGPVMSASQLMSSIPGATMVTPSFTNPVTTSLTSSMSGYSTMTSSTDNSAVASADRSDSRFLSQEQQQAVLEQRRKFLVKQQQAADAVKHKYMAKALKKPTILMRKSSTTTLQPQQAKQQHSEPQMQAQPPARQIRIVNSRGETLHVQSSDQFQASLPQLSVKLDNIIKTQMGQNFPGYTKRDGQPAAAASGAPSAAEKQPDLPIPGFITKPMQKVPEKRLGPGRPSKQAASAAAHDQRPMGVSGVAPSTFRSLRSALDSKLSRVQSKEQLRSHKLMEREKKRMRKQQLNMIRKRDDEQFPGISQTRATLVTSHRQPVPIPAYEEEIEDTGEELGPEELVEREEARGGRRGGRPGAGVHPRESPYLMFEITSEDGFHVKSESWEEAWKTVTDKVQDARSNARLKQMSYAGVSGRSMFGLNHDAVVYLIEQLYGARNCRNYKFLFNDYEPVELEEEPEENPTGAARSEPYENRKTEHDMFGFLLSRYRPHPKTLLESVETNDESLYNKRRTTSMDLPMAMRFRKLKLHAKEACGVFRSDIHGRGLFCKRDIDAGEMIIEYAGEVIRAALCDKREKYYESKGIGCYMFRIDHHFVVDATVSGNAARFINHSCEPNCYSKIINVDNSKHIVIFALRAIKRGEELTYDYKFPIEEVKIPCTCSARRCRKYLN